MNDSYFVQYLDKDFSQVNTAVTTGKPPKSDQVGFEDEIVVK